ncbi:MAG: thymidine kinase [Patescibacteria group bacterium]|nr:thymidine kinase [Patescibacteria group bacterium]MDD5490525.1 thymidine kinase [Patescibacteria group bacterium]
MGFQNQTNLTLILGPMKSGKSLHLINHFNSLKDNGTKFLMFHSIKNVRDEKIWSRAGLELDAKKVENLTEVLDSDVPIIGVDELHMFEESEAEIIRKILERGIEVVAAGLNIDYRGETFRLVQNLLELNPKNVFYKKAICEDCGNLEAEYTQVFKNSEPLLSGLPPVIPEDGTYTYKSVCEKCFIRG